MKTFLCFLLTVLSVPCAYAGFMMEIGFPGYTNQLAALTNFPALITFSNNISGSGFDYSEFISTNGYDLRFVTNLTDITSLNYEIELWDTNATSYIWVQVPILPEDGSGTILARWGNAGDAAQLPCTTNGAAWSEAYKAVWHMGQGGSTRKDASLNGYNGAVDGSGVAATNAGMIGPADSFTGTGNNYPSSGGISCGNVSVTASQTIELWLKPSNQSQRRNPINKAYGGEGTITLETNGKIGYYYGTAGYDGTPYMGFGSLSGQLGIGQWAHVTLVRDLVVPRTLHWYANGIEITNAPANYSSAGASGKPIPNR